MSIEIPSRFVNVECIANTNDLIQNEDYDMTHIPEMYFKRYQIYGNLDNFLNSDEDNTEITNLIEKIQQLTNSQADMDNLYSEVCAIYHEEMSKGFKSKQVFNVKQKNAKKCKPFWSEALHDLWKELRAQEKAFLEVNTNNRDIRTELRRKFKNAQKEFDVAYRRAERKFKKDKLNEIENICTSDPKEFWKVLKELGPKKKSVIPFEVYNEQGTVVTERARVLSKWGNDYKGLYNIINNDEYDDLFYDGIKSEIENLKAVASFITGINDDIQDREVFKCVNNTKCKKATGIDSIPYEVLKNVQTVNILTNLFKKIFDSCTVPGYWKYGIIMPIPKPSMIDARVPLQYRGITLLSTLYKLFTAILNKRLMSAAECQNIYKDEQNGFRSKRSCTEHIFSLTSIIRNRKSQKLSTFICFIDFEKAFDRVDRQLLFYKLLKIGVKGKLFNVLENIYAHAKAGVCVNGYISDWFDIHNGVRQGDSLSATLFCLYINDIIDDLDQCNGIYVYDKKITCLLYADDLVLISENENDLQNMLNILKEWCQKWRMSVNLGKTKIMHCRNERQMMSNFTFKYGESNLEYVNTYKYLGVVLDEFLNFKVTADMLAKSANRALGALCSKFKSNKGLGYKTYTKLYNTGITPILDYSAGIWGFKGYKRSEIIQNRAIRFFIGVHRFASNHAVNGDMGWLPCEIRQKLEMLRLWNRLISIDENRIVSKIFIWDKQLCNNNWSMEVKSICEEIDMIPNFENNGFINLEQAKESLCSIRYRIWRNEIQIIPKLRFYSIFKENYETEKFLLMVNNRKKRSILAQLRYSILPLRIETGRFQDIPIEFRHCLFCNENFIESEIHFMLYCSYYNDLRFTYFNKIREVDFYFDLLEENEKVKRLMNEDVIKETSKFLTEAFEKRQITLYRN